jgi:hypothetical protein
MSELSQETSAVLTVDGLLAKLMEISEEGGGSQNIGIPYDPGHATVGGQSKTTLTGVSLGFDWDKNWVFLLPRAKLGARSADLREWLDGMDQQMFQLNRVLERGEGTSEERLERMRELMASWRASGELSKKKTQVR